LDKKGFSLIEIIIAFVIFNLILGSFVFIFPKIIKKVQLKFTAYEIVNFLNYGRTWSILHDEDVILVKDNDELLLQAQNKTIKTKKIFNSIKVSLNNNLGFKGGSGNTKYAGTLSLRDGKNNYDLSLGIGFSKIIVR
jgi:Tfp pilus assembly protein FimT